MKLRNSLKIQKNFLIKNRNLKKNNFHIKKSEKLKIFYSDEKKKIIFKYI